MIERYENEAACLLEGANLVGKGGVPIEEQTFIESYVEQKVSIGLMR